VADRTESGRWAEESRQQARQRRRWVIGVYVVLMLLGGIGNYYFTHNLATRDAVTAMTQNEELLSENQKLKRQLTGQNAQLTATQIKLKNAQAALDAIMPSENTYDISPNQSLVVGSGRLTIGLVGSPANEGITITINGKSQQATAGQIINVALDPSTTCQVGVQSFDMFKAILTASCSVAKPQ
jgi:hypothetical protein